jgi:hypothetical protein
MRLRIAPLRRRAANSLAVSAHRAAPPVPIPHSPSPPSPSSAAAQLTKRYEAIVRVCQWQSGDKQRARNVGGILDKEKEIKAQLQAEGAPA